MLCKVIDYNFILTIFIVGFYLVGLSAVFFLPPFVEGIHDLPLA